MDKLVAAEIFVGHSVVAVRIDHGDPFDERNVASYVDAARKIFPGKPVVSVWYDNLGLANVQGDSPYAEDVARSAHILGSRWKSYQISIPSGK